MKLDDDCYLAYIVPGEAFYADVITDDSKRSVTVQSTSRGGGCAWEFSVVSHRFGDRSQVLRVEMFDDAWAAFAELPELFAGLAAPDAPADLEGLRRLLDGLGARDITERADPRLASVEYRQHRAAQLRAEADELDPSAPGQDGGS